MKPAGLMTVMSERSTDLVSCCGSGSTATERHGAHFSWFLGLFERKIGVWMWISGLSHDCHSGQQFSLLLQERQNRLVARCLLVAVGYL